MRTLLLAFLVALPAFPQAWSSLLDSSRAIDWSAAGFSVPNYTVPCSTQPTLQTGSGNASANKTAIQNALNSCDETHNVVNLPAGTYYVQGFNFGTQGYQVLRGAGSSAPNNVCAEGSTCLIITTTTGCTGIPAGVCMLAPNNTYAGGASVTPPNGTRQCMWTAGYAKGTTSITLNSCPGGAPSVGEMMVLDQANDLTDNGGLYMCDSYTSSQVGGGNCTVNDGYPTNADGRRIGGYTYSQKQIVKVEGVSGSGTGPFTVTIAPGVYFNNIRESQTPGAWWAGTVKRLGIERLHIDGSATTVDTIQIAGCHECWVKGVSSYNAARAHVKATVSANTVVRDNYFFQSQSHASQSYGYESEQTSAELIENNICQQITACLMSGNTSGSVVIYNYAVGSVYISPNYLQSSYASHNAGNNMYLLEGNNLLNINSDDTWGSSNNETFFRNFLAGWQKQASGPVWNTVPLKIGSYSRVHNVIGNILGQSGFHTNYEAYATSTSGGVNTNSLSVSIFGMGWTGVSETSAGTCSSPPYCDATVRPTIMRWGNYDVVNDAVRWDSTEAAPGAVAYVSANKTTGYFDGLAHTLPDSLYYSSKPSWWPAGKAWPPIGPDVTSGNVGVCTGTYAGAQATSAGQCTGGTKSTAWDGYVTSLPAQDCYLTTMGGVPDGTGNMLGFDAAACYVQAGARTSPLRGKASIRGGSIR